MRNDSGAENRGGFKVVGEGAGPDSDAAAPQAKETASSRKRNLRPKIIVIGLGGAGGNAIQNMLEGKIEGVELIVANTDAQALEMSKCERRLQLGEELTGGLGAGGQPEVGRAAAVESLENVLGEIDGASLVFLAAGMGGGTGTGSAPVIAEAIRRKGILTVAVVTKPFRFEGEYRMEVAEQGIEELQGQVDTLIVIPNQNLFKVATEKTSVADAFHKADNVLFAGVRGVTDLMVKPGLINLDFADFRTVMTQTGKAIMGAGEADGPERAVIAAEAAVANPLLEDSTVDGARGVLINVTGGRDLTLFELDQAVSSIRAKAHPSANIILGSAFDDSLKGKLRVSVLATGILDKAEAESGKAEAASEAPKQAEPAAETTAKAPDAMPAAKTAEPEPAKTEAPEAALEQAAAKQDEPEAAKPAAEPPSTPQTKAPPAEPAVEPEPAPKAEARDDTAEAPASPSNEKTAAEAAAPEAPVAKTETSSSEPQKAETPASESSRSLAIPPAAPKETPKPEARPEARKKDAPPPQAADAAPQAPKPQAPKLQAPAAEGAKAPTAETPPKAAPAPKAAEKGEVSLDEILKRAYLKQAEAQQAAAEAAKAQEKAPERQAPATPEAAPASAKALDAPEPPVAEPAPAAESTPLPETKPAAEPAATSAPAEAGSEEDGDIDRLIEQVLTRNRKAAETDEPTPQEAPPPPALAETVEPAAEPKEDKASADALLEDLAFSLAQDDAFQLDDTEPLPELKVEPEPTAEPEAPGLDELLDQAAEAKTESAPAEPRLRMPPAESGNDDEELYAELDRRARERARAALEGLSLDSDGDGDGEADDSENKAATPDEESDESLKQMMKLPSFLREKNS